MGTDGHEARAANGRSLRFIIIGAGMAGILSAIGLERAGFTDIVIFEKADRLGGTWRENTYPGVACDIPSHFYSYSFAPNPEWSHRYSSGAQIRDYLQDTARRYGVEKRIRYSEEITRCEFAAGRWHVETKRGHWDAADVVIAATGVTHQPKLPDIAGLNAFDEERVAAARNTVWTTGCRSWYLDDRGIPAAWPWTIGRFREEMTVPKLEAYELVG